MVERPLNIHPMWKVIKVILPVADERPTAFLDVDVVHNLKDITQPALLLRLDPIINEEHRR